MLYQLSYRVAGRCRKILPSLRRGADAVAQAIAHGVKVTGCTVHFVDAGVDTGPIIAQVCVPVHEDDDAERLHARIRAHEHALVPEVTRMVAGGALLCDGRRVRRRRAPDS